MAGVMNFVQISRSERDFLSIWSRLVIALRLRVNSLSRNYTGQIAKRIFFRRFGVFCNVGICWHYVIFRTSIWICLNGGSELKCLSFIFMVAHSQVTTRRKSLSSRQNLIFLVDISPNPIFAMIFPLLSGMILWDEALPRSSKTCDLLWRNSSLLRRSWEGKCRIIERCAYSLPKSNGVRIIKAGIFKVFKAYLAAFLLLETHKWKQVRNLNLQLLGYQVIQYLLQRLRAKTLNPLRTNCS